MGHRQLPRTPPAQVHTGPPTSVQSLCQDPAGRCAARRPAASSRRRVCSPPSPGARPGLVAVPPAGLPDQRSFPQRRTSRGGRRRMSRSRTRARPTAARSGAAAPRRRAGGPPPRRPARRRDPQRQALGFPAHAAEPEALAVPLGVRKSPRGHVALVDEDGLQHVLSREISDLGLAPDDVQLLSAREHVLTRVRIVVRRGVPRNRTAGRCPPSPGPAALRTRVGCHDRPAWEFSEASVRSSENSGARAAASDGGTGRGPAAADNFALHRACRARAGGWGPCRAVPCRRASGRCTRSRTRRAGQGLSRLLRPTSNYASC